MTRGFSISQVFSNAWQLWKKNWGLLAGVTFLAIMLPTIPQLLQNAVSEEAVIVRFILGIIHFILGVIAQMGIITVTLRIAQQYEVKFGDFFSTIHLFPAYLLGLVLFYLAVIGGLILLIIPGIIFGVMFSLWPYFVLDKNYGGVESLKASKHVVYGSKWDLFLLWIATLLLNILGLLLLGVGILVTGPLTMLAWALVYLELSNQQGKDVTPYSAPQP